MSFPSFEPDIAPAMRHSVMNALSGIECEHNVRILFAIESGSRAWGFPSPDSDYDARFIYVHEPDWYLSLLPGRDVIELPIDSLLDVNGWDLRKALNLLLKPNPAILEWLSSPIRYLWNDDVCAKMTALAQRTAHGVACTHHYRNLGEAQWRRNVGDALEVNYKKYLYALRPALALRWVRMARPGPPPMNLHTMISQLELDNDVLGDIARLLTLKAQTREMGLGPRMARIDDLIVREFDAVSPVAADTAARGELLGEAEALFRAIVKGEV